jgi:hypothetical protein
MEKISAKTKATPRGSAVALSKPKTKTLLFFYGNVSSICPWSALSSEQQRVLQKTSSDGACCFDHCFTAKKPHYSLLMQMRRCAFTRSCRSTAKVSSHSGDMTTVVTKGAPSAACCPDPYRW